MSRRLFEALSLGGLALKNRIVMAPMTRTRADEGAVPNKLMVEYYGQRSNAGLIITECTAISSTANAYYGAPGVFTDKQVEGWKQVTDAVHRNGGLIFLQIWHAGRASHSLFQPDKHPPIAPSALLIENDQIHTPEGKKDFETPRALEASEIPGIVADFQSASKRAQEAGFDGVEVHGANGYLIDQFLQSRSNQRTDEYGGSVEKRTRFLLEVTKAVASEWPAGRVGVRLSPNSPFNGMGAADLHEQFSHVLRELARFDLAYVHLVDASFGPFHGQGTPFNIADARKHYPGRLIVNFGYTEATAEAALAAGNADLVSFGRPFISNPDFADRVKNGWPLAPEPSMAVWYGRTAEGYTDFPAHKA